MQVRKRYYTPDEAREALPEMRRLVERLREVATEVRQLRRVLKAPSAGEQPTGAEREKAVARAKELEAELHRLHASLEEVEVEVKDLDIGLFDFPALLRGQEVCLCYRLGEDDIDWWHGVRDGYAGRRPIEGIPDDAWEWCH